MRPRTVVYVILAVILAALLIANRAVIATSTPLNFLVTRAHAPFGVLILIVAILIALADFIAHALSRYGWLRERRSLANETGMLRERAEQAEASRIRELKETVERESAAIRSQLDRLTAGAPSVRTAPRGPPDAPGSRDPPPADVADQDDLPGPTGPPGLRW